MIVIAACHTYWKAQRLVNMIDEQGFDRYAIWNGSPRLPGVDLTIPNHTLERDIGAYAAGLEATGADEAIFIHDDVERVDLSEFVPHGPQTVVKGTPNLSSWISHEGLNPQQLAHHRLRGRDRQFVRTCCFYMTADRFRSTWARTKPWSWAFEKATTYVLDPLYVEWVDPRCAVDSNIAPFLEAMTDA